MHVCFKKIIFITFTAVFLSGNAFSETNFDFYFKSAKDYQDVIVEEVRRADTIILKGKIGEKGEVIRLIGIRAPDAPSKKKVTAERDQYGFVQKDPAGPFTPIEEEAFEFVTELLKGKHVRLEFDANKKGEYHYTLAYVYLINDDTFVNIEILRHGYAHLQIRPPNTKYAEKFREAYKEARLEKRGLQGQ